MSGAPAESLAAALAFVQAKLPDVAKTKTAKVKTKTGADFQYDYADLAEVTRHILPLLGDAGLAWITKPTLNTDGKLVLAYKLMHISGEAEEGQYPLPQSGSPQEIGSAITYARRYTLCSVTGVAPEQDDDDGAAASVGDRPKTSQRRPATAKAAPAPAQAERREQSPRKTTQRAQAEEPPLPGDDGYDKPAPPTAGITAKQRGMVLALFNNAGITEREERLDISRRIVGRRDLGSANELSMAEASKLIDKLQEAEQHPDGFTGFLADLLAETEGRGGD